MKDKNISDKKSILFLPILKTRIVGDIDLFDIIQKEFSFTFKFFKCTEISFFIK
tara:strand:+ start:728 stop:889 length:162 start_codon:yes stop_codon:yes gene_type:complete